MKSPPVNSDVEVIVQSTPTTFQSTFDADFLDQVQFLDDHGEEMNGLSDIELAVLASEASKNFDMSNITIMDESAKSHVNESNASKLSEFSRKSRDSDFVPPSTDGK